MIYTDLPVYRQKDKILKALETNQVVVVESPTGSGKTTQLPVILHEAGYSDTGMIGITQPRRIAAVSVAEFIGKQLMAPPPGLVGYKMRFEDLTKPDTRIKIMTDGILLQEMKTDRLLSRYSVLMVDEAHERSLNIDFILGLLKQILKERPEFKVIISSATINAEVFSTYFNEAPVVHIETEIYPIDIQYHPLSENAGPDELTDKIVSIVESEVKNEAPGDVLVFLSGEREIKECINALYYHQMRSKLFILPLYGRLGKEEQEKVFFPTPPGKKKVVVSTNIGETSITIDGVTTVIDSGKAKINFYNPKTFTSSLLENPVSQASANQRKGRAGRTQPGRCYRLYSQDDFESRALFSTEEIYRTDLSEVVLRMAELEIRDFETFDFISPPGRQGILGAIDSLNLLQALAEDRSLSKIGGMMVPFPLLPRHARMLVEAILRYPQVMEEIIILTSFLSTSSPYLLPQGEEMAARKAHHAFADESGDFISYLKLYKSYRYCDDREKFCHDYFLDLRSMNEIINVKDQLEEIVSDMDIPITSGGSVKDFMSTAAAGLIQFVCVRSGGGNYHSLTASNIRIHPGSVMFREDPEYFIAGEIIKTSRMYARSVSPINKGWLPGINPQLATALKPGSRTGKERRTGRDRREDSKKRSELQTSDSSKQVAIGRELFELIPYKGNKKMAVLPWDKLKRILKKGKPAILTHHRKLRGKIQYKNYTVMEGDKLSNIIKALRFLNPEQDLSQKMPLNENYDSYTDAEKLCSSIWAILKLSPSGKGKTLGFIALHTDYQGHYWYRCQKTFNNAVEISLASLEVLADEITAGTDQQFLNRVNKAYRKLANIFDE